MELLRQKNIATYIAFPLVDADGDPVVGATGLDSEIDAWTDGAAPDGFADCTNEATQIGATGMYYLSLTNTEMNNDYIIIQIKSNEAKTQVILIRTQVGDPLNAAVTDDGTAINVASGRVEADVLLIEGADPTDTIRDAVVDDATRIDASALNTLSGHDPGEAIMGATDLGTGSGFTAIPWNAAWDAEVQSEVHDEVLLNNLDHLMKTPVSDKTKLGDTGGNEVPDDTVLSLMICKGSDSDTFNATTDSLEAIRDKEADIETDTQDLQTQIGAAGAGLSAIPPATIEGAVDLVEAIKVILAFCAGKSNGGGTATINFRNQADDLNRITMTVDADGNRSAVAINVT